MLKEDHQIFSELFEKGVRNYLQAGKKSESSSIKNDTHEGQSAKPADISHNAIAAQQRSTITCFQTEKKSECATSVKNNTNFQNPVNSAIAHKSRNTVWEHKNLLNLSKKPFELKVLSLNQNPFAHQKKLKNFLLTSKNIKILKKNQLLSELHF